MMLSLILQDVLGAIAGLLGLIFLTGLVAGQFRRSVISELRDSLTTANTEIDIERKRSDRLEADLKTACDELHTLSQKMETRVSILEAENAVLRETLRTGIELAPAFKEVMAEMLKIHEERSLAMLERISAEQEVRVAERHRHLADILPVEIGDALKKVLPVEERKK